MTKCHCDTTYGGKGKVPHTYHIYHCRFGLNMVDGYSYDDFRRDYGHMLGENRPFEEIAGYFMAKHSGGEHVKATTSSTKEK